MIVEINVLGTDPLSVATDWPEADRIRGTSNNGAIGDKDLEELREAQMAILDEVELLRQEVVDVNERVDFAERLLAKHNDVGALPGAGERGD